MRVTLSFDNGPTPGVTEAVLDALAARSISAWFFVVGSRLDSAPGVVARAKASGHVIGNHSWSHDVPLGERDAASAVAEITRTEARLHEVACRPPVFRPFGRGGVLGAHLLGPAAAEHLRAHRYTVALWNNVPGDWHDPAGWPVRAMATAATQDHSVIVLHDIAGACLERLDDFLDGLIASGAEFTTDLPADCLPLIAGMVTPAFALVDWRHAGRGGSSDPIAGESPAA